MGPFRIGKVHASVDSRTSHDSDRRQLHSAGPGCSQIRSLLSGIFSPDLRRICFPKVQSDRYVLRVRKSGVSLIYAGVKRSERPARIQDALARVNMSHRLHHRANQLSGGEQQRVAISRALVNNPLIVLADEPTGQLDRMHGELVMDHFEQIMSDGDKAVLIVTHDAQVASRCTRVCLLEDGALKSH